MFDTSTARRKAGVPEKIPVRDRLIVALDVPSVKEAQSIVTELGDNVTFYKIGMQLQFASGLPFAEKLISKGKKVFLDSKLLDIGETLTNAVQNIADMGVSFLTVHGPSKTIRAAVKGRGTSDLKLLVITVLTNWDQTDLRDFGLDCSVDDLVMHRVRIAVDAGADGVIASGHEAQQIRAMAGDALKIVMPGIRPDGSPLNDQKRAVTPAQAIRAGADYLVVGRPILRSTNRRKAVASILKQIESSLGELDREAA